MIFLILGLTKVLVGDYLYFFGFLKQILVVYAPFLYVKSFLGVEQRTSLAFAFLFASIEATNNSAPRLWMRQTRGKESEIGSSGCLGEKTRVHYREAPKQFGVWECLIACEESQNAKTAKGFKCTQYSNHMMRFFSPVEVRNL